MQQTPYLWAAYTLGYTHMLRIGYQNQNRPAMIEWLCIQLGDLDTGTWLDQHGCFCFVHESDALMFEMVWCTT